MEFREAVVMAGVPAVNRALFHKVRFSVGDPAAWLQLTSPASGSKTIFIVRDIEMQRAAARVEVDEVCCPADYIPEGGLSGDRETATAESVAECLSRHAVRHVVADRTLPLIFAESIRAAGIEVTCDTELGISDRRCKDEQEVAWLRQAQSDTEACVAMACEMVAGASPDGEGRLQHEGTPLTSERIRLAIDIRLLKAGYSNPTSIVAGGPVGADCHHYGAGQLYTGQPVIVDVFPRNRTTQYNGDCTRTVVHGAIPDHLVKMHAAVVAAKRAGLDACHAGATGEAVHRATIDVIQSHGFETGLPSDEDDDSYCAMTHGTGHGVGLDVHEPPLLDFKGPTLVAGDVLTIEPGLYCKRYGGIRVEDMVVVESNGCQNLNSIHEGLDWKGS